MAIRRVKLKRLMKRQRNKIKKRKEKKRERGGKVGRRRG